MQNIEWKTIKGYECLYEVSNDGRVRRLRFINGSHNFEKIKECKQTLNTWGYMTVNLCKNGKSNTKRVHRLVAFAFLDNPKNLPEVNHIDGDKLNNNVNNLEWCDRQYNIKHAYKMGLNPSKKKMIVYINSLENRIEKLEKIIESMEYKIC